MYYNNQRVLLASKHQKEHAIALPFRARLSCTLTVHDFDTDLFGTFTGEIARVNTPYETCLLKARTAAECYDYDFAVASEGSFGPHPIVPFIASAHELMVFVDRARNWVIAEQLMSHKTNYAATTIDKLDTLEPFLAQVQFPSHALIIHAKSDNRVLVKGIKDWDHLFDCVSIGLKTEKELVLATDMRAMMNPTRMAVIGELADKLALRIAALCPRCATPGFGFKLTRGALPCALCSAPTSLYAEAVWGCIQCDHEEYKPRSDGLLNADPTYCNECNP